MFCQHTFCSEPLTTQNASIWLVLVSRVHALLVGIEQAFCSKLPLARITAVFLYRCNPNGRCGLFLWKLVTDISIQITTYSSRSTNIIKATFIRRFTRQIDSFAVIVARHLFLGALV